MAGPRLDQADADCGLQPGLARHRDVHNGQVDLLCVGLDDGLGTVVGLGDDGEAGSDALRAIDPIMDVHGA